MKLFTRIEIAKIMEETALVPLFYHHDKNIVCEVVKACYLGGARVFEFTSRGPLAHEVFASVIKFCNEKCPDMILGVGSVTDAPAASLYMQLGAKFIVTPVLREDIALLCNRRKILWLPGCGSLNEIAEAEEMGCEIVKLFPGSTYGPSFVKSIKAPCPWTSIMVTGGINTTKKNLAEWFSAGVICVGIGSRLISKEIISENNFTLLKERIQETLNIIKKVRQ